LPEIYALIALTFIVAFLYSSVGHGGASGYLAILTFFSVPREQISVSALCLNLLVAGMASFIFWRQGHLSWRLTWPFLVTSIPAAFIGGMLKVPASTYSALLIFVFLSAAIRLWFDKQVEYKSQKPFVFLLSLILGGFIGILSGIVGVGGGIFLSPILLFLGWANPKQTAATSAIFILINSIAGLSGRMLRNQGLFELPPFFWMMILTAFVGGIIGSRLGAQHFSNVWLKRILAIVLLAATVKLLV
jgi:uncharacterized protein